MKTRIVYYKSGKQTKKCSIVFGTKGKDTSVFSAEHRRKEEIMKTKEVIKIYDDEGRALEQKKNYETLRMGKYVERGK